MTTAQPLALAVAKEAPPLADLLGARLLTAVARLSVWIEQGGSTSQPGWRGDFLDWQRSDGAGLRLTAELAAAERAADLAADGRVRQRIVKIFRLSDVERDLLDCTLAVAANPALAAAVAALRGPGEDGAITERLVIELFGHRAQPVLRPTSPLAIWSLVEQGPFHARLGQLLTADSDIAAAIFGRAGLDRRLAGCAESIEPGALSMADWPVTATVDEVKRLIDAGRSVRVILSGLAGAGRLRFAALVAQRLGMRLVRIAASAQEDDADLYMRAQRLALITGNLPYWQRAPLDRSPLVTSAPVQFVAATPHMPVPPVTGLMDVRVSLPALDAQGRLAVWRALMPGEEDDSDVDFLAGTRLGDLLAAAEHAPRDRDAARMVMRARIRNRIEGSGNLLSQPYGWDDLVLPPRQRDALETLIAEVRARDGLLDRDGRRAKYGGLGQSALFHGTPGTGKTMAAQIVARVLGVEIVRVDSATVQSKFIGETVKHLRDLFLQVQGSGALLLFDEADALFARRTEVKDAHDRHANADTNYLLQLIEDFDGMAILATNKKDNIDPAFIRRLRHVVDFVPAGIPEKRKLWAQHILALSDTAPPTKQVDSWAERLAPLDLSPAQIKGAALSAAFGRTVARRALPEIGDLLIGVERELAKEGRALDRKLRMEIAGHG